MARLDLRHPDNAAGEWYVDQRCIDCGTCRELAPDLFGVTRDQSIVGRQPTSDPVDQTGAWLAAQACPTQSIGTTGHQRRPGRLFPREIADGTGVFDCGYCSPDSFGATSWFVRRPQGNLLIDSPRYTPALAGPFHDRGGIDHILLTHRDDVADADRWASEFGARVWIHADDRGAAPFATDLLHGGDEVEIQPGLRALPTPGHTRGSVVFLLEDRFLFTGDSLAWSHQSRDLTAFRGACWYSWSAQTESLDRLARRHRFAWVLPGHGARVAADPDELHDRLVALVDRMARGKVSS
jgi:glyoxylase-like metal-dependent hydrolase (beta-lactamase superfamily II)/ferredoxin